MINCLVIVTLEVFGCQEFSLRCRRRSLKQGIDSSVFWNLDAKFPPTLRHCGLPRDHELEAFGRAGAGLEASASSRPRVGFINGRYVSTFALSSA